MEEEVKGKSGFDLKKYLPMIGIALAVVIVVILLISIFGGGPKKAVKNYISGMNKRNASKVVKVMDFAGQSAWKSSYKINDFSEEDYNKFIEAYEKIDKEKLTTLKEASEKSLDKSFDRRVDDYKSYKIKVDKIKSTKKLGKDLYAVKAKISVAAKPRDEEKDEEIDSANIVTFIVYKNKIIYSDYL